MTLPSILPPPTISVSAIRPTRAPAAFGAELGPQLQDQALRALLAYAGDPLQGRDVPAGDGALPGV